jgi:hypothetical protein
MKKSGPLSVIVFVLLLISCSLQTIPATDSRIKLIGKEELLSILDERGLIIFDSRYSKDWRRSDRKIRGAIRLDASEVEQLEGFYPPAQKIVIYCA